MQKLKSKILFICVSVFVLVILALPINAKERVRIALMDNYTKYESGDEFGWGLDTNFGAVLAIEHINSASNIYEYEYKIFRSGSHPAETIEAVSRAVAEGYKIIVGLNWSTHLLMVADILNQSDILVVSPLASSSVLPTKIKYFASVMADNNDIAKSLARLTKNSMNYSRVVVLKILNDEYSLDLARIFRMQYENIGGHIVDELGVLQNQHDFSSVINGLRGKQYEVVVTLFHENEAATFLASALDKDINAKFIAADGLGDSGIYFWPGLPKRYWHSVDGYAMVPWKYEIDTKKNNLFKHSFEEKHKRSPSLLAACGYDAIQVLHRSISIAGSKSVDLIHKKLMKLGAVNGVTGTMTYAGNAFPKRDMYLIRIKDGKHTYVEKIK